jgi:hypothetical protein
VSRPALRAEHLLAALNRHHVEYVVIDAFAAIAQGAPIDATYDVDFTPRRSPENLHRLSAALDDLDARIRVDALEEGFVFSHDAESLGGMQMLNLTCAAGDFDLVFTPAAAPSGYDDLVGRSVAIRIGNEGAYAASLEDIIRWKTEAGREKDIRTLPVLRQFVRDHRNG